jgi:predicted HD phosphohydrolase
MDRVSFRRMEDGTREDYELVGRYEMDQHRGLAGRLLEELDRAGNVPGPWQVTRLEHSLQTATRALRDEADEETVVCALLHDLGDALAPTNHSEFAASVLKPYVSEANHWMVKYHGLFQGYYYFHHLGYDREARERFRDHAHYARTVAFCEDWDQASFDPDYESQSLGSFVPMVERLFSRQPRL